MDSIRNIIAFLFSGIGATIFGVYLTRKNNQNTASHTEQLTKKTKIISSESNKPKVVHNYHLVNNPIDIQA